MSFLRTFTTAFLKTSLKLVQTTANYTITWANPGAARTLNIPDPGGNDDFLFAAATQTVTNKSIAASQVNSGTLGITVGIGQGGTGQTSATAAFNALDPLTTKGDLVVHNGTDSIRLAVGSNDQVLVADSGQTAGVKWAAAPGTITGIQNVTAAGSTAAGSSRIILCDATLGNQTITLPAAASNSSVIYMIKKIDSSANTVTIDANASETIDGATTQLIDLQYDSFTIACDGSNWHIV